MDGIGKIDEDSMPHVKFQAHLDCKRKCIEEKDCLMWTFYGGKCYLKNENTYVSTAKLVTSGKKGCITAGKIFEGNINDQHI